MSLKIKTITYLQLEKVVDVGIETKGVRFDVYVEDENGTAYNVEMQTATDIESALAKRTRYYQSMIDANALKKGVQYVKLKNSFIIFVCKFDPFNKKRRVYTFRNRCVESKSLELNDGATKIFLNVKGIAGKLNDDIKNLLSYVDGKPAVGKFVEKIAAEVELIKRHDRLKVAYMKLVADMTDVRLEGERKGLLKKTLEVIETLLRKGFSKEEIMEIAKCTQEQILQVKNKLDIDAEIKESSTKKFWTAN